MKEKNQKIKCEVKDCEYCDCNNSECELKEIKVCNCNNSENKEATMCDNYKNKEGK